MKNDNIILRTDTYKLGHWNQYPPDTTGVYSYLEARDGAEYPTTMMFGLQSILKTLEGRQSTVATLREAFELANAHVGPGFLNHKGWERINIEHGGKLPVRIKAVPEGMSVPVGNVMMTVENTDPELPWVTNALESVLLHVWYPMTVATRSRAVKAMLKGYLDKSADSDAGLPFMLHDFGYRGVSSDESAAIGGAAHIVNFLGTDTLLGMKLAMEDYGADLADLAFSVPATEHSVMTARGRAGEYEVVDRLIAETPTGILSVVADSFNIYDFVDTLGTLFHERVMNRDGKFVVRPDSTTDMHPTADVLVVNLLHRLWAHFGGTTNGKGYRVLDPHVGLLWGDGLEPREIEAVVKLAVSCGYSAENLVFGMGGGLLQKVNRDTQRFAFKASAMEYRGQWHDVSKAPLGGKKPSKPGRLKLIKADPHGVATVRENDIRYQSHTDLLQTVFEDGELKNPTTFAEIRARAAL